MMDDYLDDLLDRLVPTEPHDAWEDVLRRARRSRRRYTVLGAAIAVLVLAPATWATVTAFEGTPAPLSIHQQFRMWEAQAAARSYALAEAGFKANVPLADPNKAHGVLQLATSDGPIDLWATPERDGSGTCWFVGWESDLNGSPDTLGTGKCVQGNESAIDPSTWNDPRHPSTTILTGSVTGAETTVDVTLTDGSTTTLPVAEHLFLGALPPGSTLASITGRDSGGNAVGSWTPPS